LKEPSQLQLSPTEDNLRADRKTGRIQTNSASTLIRSQDVSPREFDYQSETELSGSAARTPKRRAKPRRQFFANSWCPLRGQLQLQVSVWSPDRGMDLAKFHQGEMRTKEVKT
jgi:hypothetical protein